MAGWANQVGNSGFAGGRFNGGVNWTPQQTYSGTGTLGGLTDAYEKERKEKYNIGLSNLQDIMKMFGKDYGKGVEKAALAGANEDLISRGLGGTTRPVAMSVGMKAKTEENRRSKLAEVMALMSQYTQQGTPSAPLVSSMALGANTALRSPGRLSAYFQNYDRRFTGNSNIGSSAGFGLRR